MMREQGICKDDNPTRMAKRAVFPNNNFAKGAMGVDADYASHPFLLSVDQTGAAGDTTTTDSRSQRNRASRGGGQLQTRARSSTYENGLPTLSCSRRLVPDGRATRLVLDERSWALAPDIFILVTNPIESAFATVRHRAVRMKGALSQHTARLMVFKLVIAASESWRRLQGQNQLPKVVSGATFRDGIEVASEKKSAA